MAFDSKRLYITLQFNHVSTGCQKIPSMWAERFQRKHLSRYYVRYVTKELSAVKTNQISLGKEVYHYNEIYIRR